MIGWHHRFSGREFEQAPGAGDGQESLACCSPWGCWVRHNSVIELLPPFITYNLRQHALRLSKPHLLPLYNIYLFYRAGRPAATANSLQSCPTLCDQIDGRPPGSPVPGILQARTLEWVAISFSSA